MRAVIAIFVVVLFVVVLVMQELGI